MSSTLTLIHMNMVFPEYLYDNVLTCYCLWNPNCMPHWQKHVHICRNLGQNYNLKSLPYGTFEETESFGMIIQDTQISCLPYLPEGIEIDADLDTCTFVSTQPVCARCDCQLQNCMCKWVCGHVAPHTHFYNIIYMHTYIHTCTHTCTHVPRLWDFIRPVLHTHMHTYLHTYVWLFFTISYTYIHAYIPAHMLAQSACGDCIFFPDGNGVLYCDSDSCTSSCTSL